MNSIPRCSNDDSGTCCGKCGGIVAVIPVFGRLQLVKHTIQRLLHKNKVSVVVCVISIEDDRKVCEEAGAYVIKHSNFPLGAKWNAGFVAAAKFKPIGCLFVGSSDWLSDNWTEVLGPMLKDYDMIGTPGCHFLDINTQRGMKVVQWPGYVGERGNETIGIGRLLSARILEKINWKPFEDAKDNSLDYQMNRKVIAYGGKVFMHRGKEIIAMSISTDQWVNKHKFSDHTSGKLPSNPLPKITEFLLNNFPEALKVFTQ